MPAWTWDYYAGTACIVLAAAFLLVLIFCMVRKKSKFVPAMGLFSSLFLLIGIAFTAVFPQTLGTSASSASMSNSRAALPAMQAIEKNVKNTESALSSETMLQFDTRRADERMTAAEVRFSEEAGMAEPSATASSRKSGSSAGGFNTYNNMNQQRTKGYVLNTKTKKFHRPACRDVPKIAPKNYAVAATREEAIKKGYKPCEHCNP